ncbi:MAG TPA: hypothetical protein PLR88_06780 [Bacteroidales bacterium]|nr:hypothetical protein [Bacteroidales bacterium]HPT21634.1 hypothetical protein [Bacteroidales bacterium]
MKKFILWSLAFVITVTAAVYQRKTGPTNPKQTDVTLNDTVYKLKLVRSLSLDERPEVKLKIYDTTIKATLYYKRFKTNDEYKTVEFDYKVYPVNSPMMNKIFKIYEEKGFFAEVPQQPEAGKLQYYLEITDSEGTRSFFKESPVVIRFKGGVPSAILVPHILIMFLAMFFSTAAGLMSLVKDPSYKKYSVWTVVLFFAGAMVFGPLVQYYAFGEFWTGIPFGWDLTDNKSLIALLFWILAIVMNRKKERPFYIILAAVILLMVYSIPHSLFGSELNYSSGQVTQGIII